MARIRWFHRIVLLACLPAASLPADAQSTIRKGSEFQISARTVGPQSSPVVEIDNQGNFVLAWSDPDGNENGVFVRRFSRAGVALGAELQVNTYTTSYQELASLAVDGDGDFLVVWASTAQQDGSGSGVFGRRVDSSGVPQGVEILINAATVGSQGFPQVGVDDTGAFIVVWMSPDASGNGVFARRLSSSGVPVGLQIQVNLYATASQLQPAVAVHGNGNFVVTWASSGQDDGATYGVFARRFNSSGTPLAAEFQVNSYTPGPQYEPEVAADSAGDFVVAWVSSGQDGSQSGIFARRFDSAGTPLGSEFRVNRFTEGVQNDPKVARDGDGDFVVVWTSIGQDGNASGVFARRFGQSGNGLAVEFQVNSYTTNTQFTSTVALREGDFMVAWASGVGQDGSYTGVFGQRFAALATLDIDGDGSYRALTDALLLMRFLFGFEGNALIANAVGVGCTRCLADTIAAYLGPLTQPPMFSSAVLDIDDNLNVHPRTDGLLVLRDAFGLEGESLIDGLVDTQQCERCTAEAIKHYLDVLKTE